MSEKHKLRSAGILLLALSSLPIVASADDFPSNRKLAEQNVALSVQGWKFSSGLGEEKGNGLAAVPVRWVGSGFIVKRDGTLVTNYHVVARALAMQANFDAMASRGGATYQVPYIKVYDPANDLAIMQIDGAANFDAVPLGNSDRVQPRDDVLAVGNPQNMGINITEGSISQVQRDRRTKKPMRLVHTAQITSGNSGGSLYSGSKVVGVNVSVAVNRAIGGQTGFNHAVPINLVKNLLENREYDRTLLLRDTFSPALENLDRKIKQISAGNKSVPAAGGRRDPGVWSTTVRLNGLTDYLIYVRTPDNVDLDIIAMQGDRVIGHGGLRKKGHEALAITNENRRDVKIGVISYYNQPISFGIKLYKIVW